MKDIKTMLADLHSEIFQLRQSATMALWSYWYLEAGEIGKWEIQRGVDLMGQEKAEEARSHFKKVIEAFPAFAEAHN